MAEDNCQLLGGVFSMFIQFCLAGICVLTLVYKRQTEIPRRDWLVWFLDVAKQGVGSSFGHFANIFVSMVIAGSITGSDECQWYCLNYVIDTTLGTVLNLTFLSLFEKLVQHYQFAPEYLNFGEYGDPPSMSIFALQLSIWLLFVVMGKCVILFVLFLLVRPLDEAIGVLFQIFKGYPNLELVTVMIIIPTILNSINFWVTDTFLKRQETPGSLNASIGGGGGSGHGDRSGSRKKYKHNRLSSSDSDVELDEDLISNGNLGGSPTVSSGYKSLNISKHPHKGDVNPRVGSSSSRGFVPADSSKGHKRTPGGSSSGGGSGTAYNQYIPDPTKILNDSTKMYVLPPASYVARMYKKGTANMPNLWSAVWGNSPAPGSTPASSQHNSSDEHNEEGPSDEEGASPTANPLIPPPSGSAGASKERAAAYKKNDSFGSVASALPTEGAAKTASRPAGGSTSGGGGGGVSGKRVQRNSFNGDGEGATSYV